MKKCCICQKPYDGDGNNAHPLMRGRCCDACNAKYIIPCRLFMQQEGRIRIAADGLPHEGKRTDPRFKQYLLKRVKITFIDGGIYAGVLHIDTPATRSQTFADKDNKVIVGYYIDTGKTELHFKKSHVKKIELWEGGGNA